MTCVVECQEVYRSCESGDEMGRSEGSLWRALVNGWQVFRAALIGKLPGLPILD